MEIYVDTDIIIINKPSGLRSIQDGYDLNLPSAKSVVENKFGKVWVVHRLDKDTSGLLVFARNAAAHKSLNEQFQNRLVKKEYHAIIYGTPDWNEYSIDIPLHINGDRKHRTVPDYSKGKAARTDCVVLERYKVYSRLLIKPHSGYTHQIRSHLAAIGYPILGDTLYLKKTDTTVDKLFLHAESITFQHPTQGDWLSFHVPFPEDWEEQILKLKDK